MMTLRVSCGTVIGLSWSNALGSRHALGWLQVYMWANWVIVGNIVCFGFDGGTSYIPVRLLALVLSMMAGSLAFWYATNSP